ncbi:hypothetical protein RvY_00630 [Ramazzottius varieornatus]|uniref:HTH TFE/IIEalpha-type domain-containing protein n=1 Tax=Ramazzottius varieornatus TaxID=947166 RepID=A0A1D1UN99_RAMVA|nr:hypothetical protein RvY_00630 [Ramazzottius varieornatus]
MDGGWAPTPIPKTSKVPYQVQQLARMVAYAFYGKEHGLIVDVLCRYSSVKEDDLCDVLKLEKKQVRQLLANLKADHIIASKQKLTKDAINDISSRVYEYGMEYSTFLNMVKYKLDQMRRKLEVEERHNANRAAFICQECKRSFQDLETGELIDFMTGKMVCTYCGGEVDEDTSAPAEKSQQVMMAHFNDSLSPFFNLIHEIDAMDLAPEDLRTDFSDSSGLSNLRALEAGANGGTWSSDKRDYNYTPQNITINLGETEVVTVKAKEQPVWLTKSTVMDDDTGHPSVSTGDGSHNAESSEDKAAAAEGFLSVLMKHEKEIFERQNEAKSAQRETVPSPPMKRTRTVDNLDEVQEETGEEDEFDEVEERADEGDDTPKISVGHKLYSLDEITDELVAQMTEKEKQNYIRVGQQAFTEYSY